MESADIEPINLSRDSVETLSSNDSTLPEVCSSLESQSNCIENEVENPATSNQSNCNNIATTKSKRKNQPKKNVRKRKADPNCWIDNKAKKARTSGTEGVGRNGVDIKPRKMREGCGENCFIKCHSKLSLDDRECAFKLFWEAPSHSNNWDIINNWVEIKEDTVDDSDSSDYGKEKSNTMRVYQLPKNNSTEFVPVCRKMFLDTLDISEQWVRTALKKKSLANANGLIEPDKRGKHHNRPFKYDDDTISLIKNHIEKFPVIESHYCRENSNKKYLEEGLSVAKMHRMFIDELKEKKETADISVEIYRKILNTEYNYGFFKPKKDRCEQCERFNNFSAAEKITNQGQQDFHLNNKKLARELMSEAKKISKKDKTVCTFNFDLQKVLTTPRADIGPLYYMSKLNVWNFSLFDLESHEGVCFLWDETVGNRGSNEIASFLMSYLVTKIEASPNLRSFQMFSDNCTGQNKNKIVFSMFIKIALQYNVKICHRFLETGHTQCPGDSIHARVETHVKNKSVFTKHDWGKHIAEAREKQPYIVRYIEQSEIMDFTELSDLFNWKKFGTSGVRELTIDPSEEKLIFVKYNFNEKPTPMKILKPKITKDIVKDFPLHPAYTEKLQLSSKKKEDLKTMVKKGYVPEQFKNFYNEIIA